MANAVLRAPLVSVMESQQPEERLQRVWLGVRAQREARRHSGFWQLNSRLIVAAAACSCLVILLAWSLRLGWPRTESATKPLAVPARIEPGQVARNVDFGDGGLVNVHPGAQLDVLDQSERSVVLALRRGVSRFDIRPGGVRRWRIECGAVTVEVVGTRFSIERTDASVRVAVERGRVLVRGPGVPDQVQSLETGNSIVVGLTPAANAGANAALPTVTEGEPLPEPVRRPSSWRSDTEGTQTTGGLPSSDASARNAAIPGATEVIRSAVSDAVAGIAPEKDDVAELLAQADAARLSGHPHEAVASLRRIVGSHSQDPRAAMAAFTMGRLLLEGLGQPMQASFAFERALALKLPAALEEDALARLVESHAKAGATAQARATAASYRTRYPAGRRLGDVNRWSPAE